MIRPPQDLVRYALEGIYIDFKVVPFVSKSATKLTDLNTTSIKVAMKMMKAAMFVDP